MPAISLNVSFSCMKRTTKLRLSAPHLVCSAILCILFTNASAQFLLQVKPIDKDSAFIQALKLNSSFRTKDQVIKYVDQLPHMMQARGYAVASIDSVLTDS